MTFVAHKVTTMQEAEAASCEAPRRAGLPIVVAGFSQRRSLNRKYRTPNRKFRALNQKCATASALPVTASEVLGTSSRLPITQVDGHEAEVGRRQCRSSVRAVLAIPLGLGNRSTALRFATLTEAFESELSKFESLFVKIETEIWRSESVYRNCYRVADNRKDVVSKFYRRPSHPID